MTGLVIYECFTNETWEDIKQAGKTFLIILTLIHVKVGSQCHDMIPVEKDFDLRTIHVINDVWISEVTAEVKIKQIWS